MSTFKAVIAEPRRVNLFGLDARYIGATVRPDEKVGCFCKQELITSRPITGYGAGGRITVKLRFDDSCRNGHNTFAITADITTDASRRRNDVEACGCLHDDIARVFPELAHLIKWHLTSTDGPLHYAANVLYLAGDADFNGRRAGEVSATARRVRFGNSPVTHPLSDSLARFIESRRDTGDFQVVAIAYEKRQGDTYDFSPKYTFVGYGDKWHACPFDSEREAREWAAGLNSGDFGLLTVPTAWSTGKARELDKARSAAVWPDATDAELSQPRDVLAAVLDARLPALVAAFRADVAACGFAWSPAELVTTSNDGVQS